ncbi:putative quinol monooxygenase [Geobacter sp. AOG1]|uniref:putative quinol monooxygenase n=1 Tax=Geobacter sp. AOG1 TaxID=1566346 RepID=UPI001CC66B4E|nr:putative quinol monooxygenase [Geobacter sp. AOG1]GFE58729.1 antibiotic biosynthesis monooxygenase [Geobacter sp. AOG1]
MSTITVVAKLVAKKDSIAAVKTELLKLVAPTRKEQGCIEYRLHQDNADPAVFVFYENWENATCLEKHMSTDHYKAYVSAVDGIIEGKTVNKMIQIA